MAPDLDPTVTDDDIYFEDNTTLNNVTSNIGKNDSLNNVRA
jgi:hypothetical protein